MEEYLDSLSPEERKKVQDQLDNLDSDLFETTIFYEIFDNYFPYVPSSIIHIIILLVNIFISKLVKSSLEYLYEIN